ncbi:MAG TPA: HPr family phosphocarrier protein [Myxococcales bacterium]|nr:HPr family phosphocarrier protein [Myxococcales bacterium]
MAEESIEKVCTVRNKMGLHARPAAQIVQTANRYPCDVTLEKDGQSVNGKSIMGVLMLAAALGTSVTVRTEGEQARQCADAIGDLFEKGFNEEIG